MYRVKFILSDGRKIYPTDKGRIQLVEHPCLEEAIHRGFVTRGGYTQDLGLFLIGQPDLAPLKIVDIAFEYKDSPLDRTAFVLGGKLAVQTFQAWNSPEHG